MEDLQGSIGQGVNPGDKDTNREFSCGCGKDYLSYASLYTHIKTKHEGKAPEGSSPMKSSGKKNRGRPRREEAGTDSVESITSYDSEVEILRKNGLVGKTKEPTLDSSPLKQQFYDWKKRCQKPPKPSCEDVFVLYLLDLQNTIVSDWFYKFSQILHLFRSCLNVFDIDKNQCTSSVEPSLLPFLFNHFIVEFLPKEEAINRDEAILFSMHFCTWLFNREYTTYKLNLVNYSEDSQVN